MCFHPRIFVFTWDKNLFYEKCKKEKISLKVPFFIEKEVYSHFDEIKQILFQQNINQISNDNNLVTNHFNGIYERDNIMRLGDFLSGNGNNEDLTFERVENLKELQSLILYFQLLKEPDSNGILQFNRFLISKFKDNKINYLIEQIINDAYIPSEILLKYWIRIYTLDSNFYREMNESLRKKDSKEYSTFIREIYKGFRNNLLNPFVSGKLYRGSQISKVELDNLKKLYDKENKFPDIKVLIRSFLSFSKNKAKAIGFIPNVSEIFEKVLYIIEDNRDISYVFNSSIEKYSYFPSEEEVLFFPYCGFSISQIIEKNEQQDYTEIHLNY